MTNEKELREDFMKYFPFRTRDVAEYREKDNIIKWAISKFHSHTQEVVVNFEIKWLFEKSGQCSSLYRAHPETEWEKGWNLAVESMLKYIPQPSLKDYDNAITLLKEDNNK